MGVSGAGSDLVDVDFRLPRNNSGGIACEFIAEDCAIVSRLPPAILTVVGIAQ